MKIVNPEPVPGVPGVVQGALDNLRAAPAEIRRVVEDYRQTVYERGLAVSHDPNLTAEGRESRMREIRQAAGEAAAAALKDVQDTVDSDRATVKRHLERKWPAPAAGLEAMLTRQAAWARCRSLLEAGLSPRELLAETTDAETLHALREELPTWIRANPGRAHGRASAHLIDKRLAEVSGEYASGALQADHEAETERVGLEPMLAHAIGEVRGMVDASAHLSAAIAAEYARQRTRAGGDLGDVA